MFITVTLLSLLSQFPSGLNTFRTCVPNTQFLVNGHICFCDNTGRWSEINCHVTGRRYSCQPGQIIWQDCSQCICQENGQLICTNVGCSEDPTTHSPMAILRSGLNTVGPRCTPFRSYFHNCSICVCPASGRTTDARCAADFACYLHGPPSSPDFSISKNICLPKVMYLFPCIHCLCSDRGYFIRDKCIETCQVHQQTKPSRRCIPNTFYRRDCNVCLCPSNSIPDDKYCTNVICNIHSRIQNLQSFLSNIKKCAPLTFMKPKCVYCDCQSEGIIDKTSCLELDCLKNHDVAYDVARDTCSVGEAVLLCMECFCLQNGSTTNSFCSKGCSYKSKLDVLNNILKIGSKNDLLDRDILHRTTRNIDSCEPNSVYVDQGRYCLCPENGNPNFKLCTSVAENLDTSNLDNTHTSSKDNQINIDFNVTCEPSTFVDFDCNTCFCSKNGRIDPKWCTYDDCESKKTIEESQKSSRFLSTPVTETSGACNPGSISKVDCNLCICSENGILNERACTKNHCSGFEQPINNDRFVCEPLAYYEVDCNICLCPRDGLKNVAKCTKNLCEKNFLRSPACVPGQLFSDECNVCICPPNGDKEDKACTNHTCPDAAAAWKKIFKLSQTLLGNPIAGDATRNIDLCFPGEEFVLGCELCVCPEMGLRSYATCTQILCEDEERRSRGHYIESETETGVFHLRSRREERERESCLIYNLTDSAERSECTPGSMYIIRCKQCICPYIGNINNFCRPLPDDTYCEQAYPYFNYLPMGRRTGIDNTTFSITTKAKNNLNHVNITHEHTKYKCEKPGKVLDECFICDCDENNVVIVEHCFRSDATNCTTAEPSFLGKDNKIDLG